MYGGCLLCSLYPLLLSPNYNPSSFFFDQLTPAEIEHEILLIPKIKTYGLYSCPIRVLTEARCVISGPLSIIINISKQKGFFPPKLKKAKVVPVYKNDDETEPGNYRPISLLSIFNRIFEKLMYHRLKSYLGKNDILFKSQYGFRENHSTQHAIIDIVNVIQNNMDQKRFTCGTFLVELALAEQDSKNVVVSFFFFCLVCRRRVPSEDHGNWG